MADFICPCCGSQNVQLTKTEEARVKEKAFAGGYAVGTVKRMANEFVPGLGYLIPRSAAYTFCYMTPLEHVCNDCYQFIEVKYALNGVVEYVRPINKYTDACIEEHRINNIAHTEWKIKSKKSTAIVCGVIALIFLFISMSAFGDGSFTGFLLGLMNGVPALILGIIAIVNSDSLTKMTHQLQRMRTAGTREYCYAFMQ